MTKIIKFNPNRLMLNEIVNEIKSHQPFWCTYTHWNFSRPARDSGYFKLLNVISNNAPIKFMTACRACGWNRYSTHPTTWNRLHEARLIEKTSDGWQLSDLGKRYVIAAKASFV